MLAVKKPVPTKTRPATTKTRSKPVKREIGKIGGRRGNLGIVMTEEDPQKEESKEESKDSESRVMTEEGQVLEESTLSGGQNNTSLLESHGVTDQSGPKEPVLDELTKLYTKFEKSKNPAMCAKITGELESLLAKFKQLSTASNEAQPESAEPEPTPVPSTAKTSARKTATGANTSLDKGKRAARGTAASKVSPNKKPIPSHERSRPSKFLPPEAKPETKAEEKKKKKPGKNDQTESISEEIKQKVYELYGDDAQFDDIQLQLVTALKEDKRSKSATPNKSAGYKGVVLKLHNKVMQKQKESEADILKRLIERQKKAQEQRKLKSLERQQVAKKNKERLQQVKERQAELEAEKQKQIAENEQRLQLADVRYEKRLNEIRTKARAEGEKVEEVLFIKDAGVASKRALTDLKITETNERRKAILDQTKQKQDMIGQRCEMAEKKRLALLEEQRAKLLQSQQKRDDAEARRKEMIDQKKFAAEEATQKAALANERKKQLYDEVMNLYTYLCKKENLWECLESGIQWWTTEDVDLSKLTPFGRIKRKLLQDYNALNKILSVDSNGNLIIKKPRKDSILTTFPFPENEGNENNMLEPLSDYENPYPEMASSRKQRLNKTWSCTCFDTGPAAGEEEGVVGYGSDQESKEQKTESKKPATKSKGKKGASKPSKGKPTKGKAMGGTNYSSYKANAPSNVSKVQQKSPPEKKLPEPSVVAPNVLKRKYMNVTPSVPELARTEPELLKERVVLIKDTKSGEYCKNKLTLKLVDINEIVSLSQDPPETKKEPTPLPKTPAKAPVTQPKLASKAPKAAEEEAKLVKPDLQVVVRDEVIEKIQTFIYAESPLQIETESEELVKWVESKNAKPIETVYWCKLCDLSFSAESAITHLESKDHAEVCEKTVENDAFLSHLLRVSIVVVSDNSTNELLNEKAKLLKKKAKKIKQSLEVKSMAYESYTHTVKDTSSYNRQRLHRLCIDLDKQVHPYIKDYDLVENTLKEILKIVDQRIDADLQLLRHTRTISTLIEVCKRVFCCPKGELKSLGRVLEVIMKMLSGFTTLRENRIYLLVTNKLIVLVELLMWCLMNINAKFVVGIPFLPTLLQILTVHIKQKVEHEQLKYKDAFIQYIYCYGVLNKLKAKVFQVVNGPLDLTDSKNVVPSLLLSCVMFLEALTMYTCIEPRLSRAAFEKPHKASEDAQFVIQQTELYGVIPLLSKILLAKGPLKEANPVILPYTIQTLGLMSLKILNNCCRTDLNTVQGILKLPYYSEQVYHLLNYLMQYSIENVDNSEEIRELLHETILFAGYIALLDSELQALFSKGEHTLVQKLCNLPIQYFQDKKMKDILFPTLVSVVHNNERNFAIMGQEIDTGLIADYLKIWINTKEEDAIQDNLSISGASSAFDMLLGTCPFICFSKRVPKKIWEDVLAACLASAGH